MDDILIKYQDGAGAVTERRISDIHSKSDAAIEAFCHLRSARRTFNIDNIVSAINPTTGDAVDPWKLIENNSATGNRESLEVLTWKATPAIKALKIFTLTTRGFSKRERGRLIQFIKEISDATSYSEDEINEWVRNLLCTELYSYRSGETAEYTELLRSIEPTMLKRCREYALVISRGSGRKPIDPSWIERIENEFSNDPYVKKPKHYIDEDNRVSVTISAALQEHE